MRKFFAVAALGFVLAGAFGVATAQQSAPLSNGDANTLQLAGQAAAAFWTALSNATAAILNLQTKQASDETTIAALRTQEQSLASQLAAAQTSLASLSAQFAAIPRIDDGACTLSAGTCTVTFNPPFQTAPKCAIGATASPALTISIPTVTGFAITSSTPTDTQTVDWICRK